MVVVPYNEGNDRIVSDETPENRPGASKGLDIMADVCELAGKPCVHNNDPDYSMKHCSGEPSDREACPMYQSLNSMYGLRQPRPRSPPTNFGPDAIFAEPIDQYEVFSPVNNGGAQ